MLGIIKAVIFSSADSTKTTLHIIKGASGNHVGFNTAAKLGFLKILNQVKPDETDPQSPLNRDFESLFGGIGKVKEKSHKASHMDPDIEPKQRPHRQIPFYVKKDFEMELKRLEELDIIEIATGPTPWMSPYCHSPQELWSGENMCRHTRGEQGCEARKTPNADIDDLVSDLNGATFFSKLDLSSGYHQLELAQESPYITTFSTHVGLRRYKRLLFGISTAFEIYQNAIDEILTSLPGW